MTNQEIAKVLRDGAAYGREHGHAKFEVCNSNGSVCFRGALIAGQQGTIAIGSILLQLYREWLSVEEADLAFQSYLKRKFKWQFDSVGWNNHFERNGEEVWAAMEDCANELDPPKTLEDKVITERELELELELCEI